MKLYTEEQLQEAYNRGLMDGRLNNIDYSITNRFKPIELPTNEEIGNNAYTDRIVDDWEHEQQIGFERGAKWIKEQILNQNK